MRLKGKPLVNWSAYRMYMVSCKHSYADSNRKLEEELRKPEAAQNQEQVQYYKCCIRMYATNITRLDALLTGRISHSEYMRLVNKSQQIHDKRRDVFQKRHGKDYRITDDGRFVTKNRYDSEIARKPKDDLLP